MGYESRLYVVGRFEGRYVLASVIAEYDLCKMGGESYAPEFYKAFKREIDYPIYVDDEERYEDCYGDKLKAADLDELIAALTAVEQREHYRRIPPLVAMLTALSLSRDEWETDYTRLEVVHYGY